MKKMIIVALCIISMLIAFTSCDEPTVLPTGTAINDFADLKAFAEGTGEYAEVTEAYIATSFEITEGVTFKRAGITLDGNDQTLTVADKKDMAPVFGIAADGITFNGVNVDVTGSVDTSNNTKVIQVLANSAATQSGVKDFVFDGGTISGQYAIEEGYPVYTDGTKDQPAKFNAVMGIDFQIGTSGSVLNSTIKGCVAPINASTGDITIEKVAINGHIYFDTAFGESKPTVKGVSSISDDWAGHVDFTSAITDGEALAKEMLKENSVKFYVEYKEVTAE